MLDAGVLGARAMIGVGIGRRAATRERFEGARPRPGAGLAC